MTMTESRLYLQLGDSRDEAVKATITTKATLAKVLKSAATFRHVIGELKPCEAAELITMTETLKGLMFLSPSGTSVYVLKPTTRKINGVSTKMLSVVANIPLGDVLSFEVAA